MIEVIMQHDHDCSRKGEVFIHYPDCHDGVYHQESIRCEQTSMELRVLTTRSF